jgi:23S rRNA (cytosine1962-C5)-methyltransferase
MAYVGLTMSAQSAGWLERGHRDLPLESVAGTERCEPGQPVRLLAPAGSLAGLGVADPENELLRVFCTGDEGVSALDLGFFRARARRALARRAAFGLSRERTSHRLVNAAGDGLPGLAVDVYGEYAVLYAYSRGLVTLGRLLADALLSECDLKGVVLKLRGRNSAEGPIKQELFGAPVPERCVAHEEGVPFEVHLTSGLNVGLFTDMREHRARLSRFVQGRSVLNTFSYTGSLSVAAARAGASSVTSVDLAAGVHNWARENFRLSGLPTEGHRFETTEVSAFLKKAARAGETYDVIIVDPPTYSAARAGAWAMKKDYPELIVRAAALLSKDGLLWLAANSRELPPLPQIAEEAFARAKRSAQLLEVGGLPPDYPTALAQGVDRYLQVGLFRVE